MEFSLPTAAFLFIVGTMAVFFGLLFLVNDIIPDAVECAAPMYNGTMRITHNQFCP